MGTFVELINLSSVEFVGFSSTNALKIFFSLVFVKNFCIVSHVCKFCCLISLSIRVDMNFFFDRQVDMILPVNISITGNCTSYTFVSVHGGMPFMIVMMQVSSNNWLFMPSQFCLLPFHCALFRLHGVCNENPLAPLIRSLGLTLYRTSGDNSVLYDHDLQR